MLWTYQSDSRGIHRSLHLYLLVDLPPRSLNCKPVTSEIPHQRSDVLFKIEVKDGLNRQQGGAARLYSMPSLCSTNAFPHLYREATVFRLYPSLQKSKVYIWDWIRSLYVLVPQYNSTTASEFSISLFT